MQLFQTPAFVLRWIEKLEKVLVRIELIALLLTIAAVLLWRFENTISQALIHAAMLPLSMVYYLRTLKSYPDNKYDQFLNRLINFSYCVATIGILFLVSGFLNGTVIISMAQTGIVFSIAALILFGLFWKRTSILTLSMVQRTLIFAAILLLLQISPIHKSAKEQARQKYELLEKQKSNPISEKDSSY